MAAPASRTFPNEGTNWASVDRSHDPQERPPPTLPAGPGPAGPRLTALIRRLAAEGVPKAQIAARLEISRTTVIKAVNSESPPKYERMPRPTSFTPFEDRVRQLLAETPGMPATVIAERVEWSGSIRWFRDNVRRLRPEHHPVDPADRLFWAAGDAAQCDLWFPPRKIPLEDGTHGSSPPA